VVSIHGPLGPARFHCATLLHVCGRNEMLIARKTQLNHADAMCLVIGEWVKGGYLLGLDRNLFLVMFARLCLNLSPPCSTGGFFACGSAFPIIGFPRLSDGPISYLRSTSSFKRPKSRIGDACHLGPLARDVGSIGDVLCNDVLCIGAIRVYSRIIKLRVGHRKQGFISIIQYFVGSYLL
jgi:hypothetical protein